MPLRTTAQRVRSIGDFGTELDLHPFVVAANALVDHVVSKDSAGLLTGKTQLLIEIETYLAAFFAAVGKDKALSGKSTGAASGQFQTGQRGPGWLQQNDYGLTAMGLDISGTLAVMNAGNNRKVSIHWLGKTTQERQNWSDRNTYSY